MCARYSMVGTAENIARTLSIQITAAEPAYNIAPTDPVAAVVERRDSGREVTRLRWGLIPFWAKDPGIGVRMINARMETVATRSAFREPFHNRRCLILADGFYEWKREGKKSKRTFYFARRDRAPFAFAGLWSRWKVRGSNDEAARIESCTIITRPAEGFVAQVHDRMPSVLPPESWPLWLDRTFDDTKRLEAALATATLASSSAFEAVEVSSYVNNVRNKGAECIVPLASTG